jgi:hypothetical protein
VRAMVESSTPIEAPEPRYGAFRITFPTGTALDSYWLIEGGGTLRQVQVEHPLAAVEADENSRVTTPG